MNFEQEYFEKIYDDSYDQRNPKYKFQRYLKSLRKIIPHGKLLDIGCAYGSFIKEAEKYFDVNGSDISEHAIEIAQKRLPECTFTVSDINNLQFDRKFDAITCFDILEHVPNIEEALNKLKVLLSTSGVILISVPVYDGFVGKLVTKLDKDPTHVHKISRYGWLDLLQSNGFEIINWEGIWRYYFKNTFYLHYQSTLTRFTTPAILIACRPK